MPKRKQPSKLITKDSAGNPLARRKRRFSHGIERQAGNDKALIDEGRKSLLHQAEQEETEIWYDWWIDRERFDYLESYDLDYRYLDKISAYLAQVATSRSLLDVAPAGLRFKWFDLQSKTDETLNRLGLEHRINAPWDLSKPIESQIGEHLVPFTTLSVIFEVCESEQNLSCANAILYYAPLWIRRPNEFSGGTIRELVEHLFVRYAVPNVLYKPWLDDEPNGVSDHKWLQWFICIGQGGSLYKLGQLAEGWKVSRRFQHEFSQQVDAPTIAHAIAEAELSLLGVSAGVANLLLPRWAYRLDATALWLEFDEQFLRHWRDTARWLDRHLEELDEETARYLLGWSNEQFRWNRHFTWRHRTVAASLRHADEAFEAEGVPFVRWKTLNKDWIGTDGWTVVELNDTTALHREGAVLNHCVGRYGQFCVAGRYAIFSLRQQGKPVITVQFNPKSGLVGQALGYSNRACSTTEMKVLQQWLTETTIAGSS